MIYLVVLLLSLGNGNILPIALVHMAFPRLYFLYFLWTECAWPAICKYFERKEYEKAHPDWEAEFDRELAELDDIDESIVIPDPGWD